MNAAGWIRTRGLVGTIVAVAALAGIATSGTAAAAPRGPAGLGFYDPPKALPGGHGALIWARKANGLVPLANAASTRLVLYTSRTPQGKNAAVSGSVSVPKGKPPKGGWPVITYAHGTTGTADACAPSRNREGDPAEGYISYVYPQLNDWLQAGYAVVQTDYQGLGTPGPHPYLIGAAEGHSVLDIVRAARGLDPDIGKRFLIAGHSQGGHAALFAAGEAKGYVPDLTLRGTVAYAPASHLKEQGQVLSSLTTPSGLTALATLIVQGATTQSTPSAPIKPGRLLSDQVLGFYPLVKQLCLSQLSKPNRLAGIAPADMLRSGADTTDLFNLLGEQNPAVTTGAPVMIAQGDADTTVFKAFTDVLVNELGGNGDDVNYDVFPGVDHGSIVAAAETDALDFFEARLPAGH
jgi:pimeloyl-ACP methyl ester carboxylesterase